MKRLKLKSDNNVKPKRFRLRIEGQPEPKAKRFQLQIEGKNKPIILGKDTLRRALAIIGNAGCYCSGMGVPTPSDYSDQTVVNRLTEQGNEYWINFLENNDERLIKLEVKKYYATLHLRSMLTQEKHFIIFEDRHGKTYIDTSKTQEDPIPVKDGGTVKKKGRKKGKRTGN